MIALYTAPAVLQPDDPRVRALLPPDRIAAALRLRIPQARACAVTADLLLRAAVRAQMPHIALPFARAADANGKPYLPDLPDLHFSLSHSAGRVICAVAAVPVGADTECVRRVPDGLIARCCTPAEQTLLRHPEDFFPLWMCKEAVMKCCGLGLRLPPREIALAQLCPPVLSGPVRGQRYALSLVPLPDGGQAAVCVKGLQPPAVQIRACSPAQLL